jgi:hypothetical protein
MAGFISERVVGFTLECMAGFVGIRIYQAVNVVGPGVWTPENAKLLLPRIPKENGLWRDYGVILQPTPPRRAALLPDQKLIFEHYGYSF